MMIRTATRTAAFAAALLLSGAAQAEIVGAEAFRSADGRLVLTWTETTGAPVDVFVGPDPAAGADAMRLVSANDADGRHELAAQAARSYVLLRVPDGTTYRLAERLVPLQGAMNFRDVGGYQTKDGRFVRWGKIYRSASLGGLTPEDFAKVQALGVRYIYDLRSVEERKAEPTRWPDPGVPLASHDYSMDLSAFMAVFRDSPTAEKARAAMTAFYPALVDSHKPQFRAVFAELLTDGEGAILYHCSAGKDRTGVQTALILSALGVPRETVVADFALSNRYYRMDRGEGGQSPMGSLPSEVIEVLGGVEPAYIEAFFAEVDRRYGGVEGYLAQELGVDAEALATLRARYTE